MGVVQGDELVDQALGVQPAKTMQQDIELAGVVTDDGQVLGHAMVQNTSQQCPFGGSALVALCGDPQMLQMAAPLLLIGEVDLLGIAQSLHHRVGQLLLVHVRQRLLIDPIVAVARAQQLQEVDSALVRGALEPGKRLVADVGHVAIVSPMPRAGVVDGDIARAAQTRTQQLVFLVVERVLAAAEQRIDLSRGDIDAPLAQLLEQQRLRDLAMVVLVQNITRQQRSEMSILHGCWATDPSRSVRAASSTAADDILCCALRSAALAPRSPGSP